ncbi:MAG: MBL fold metallo-hydrolase [Candidatus Omnitrophica bacterium]|nr:MBL fold metallo-hydrolase [Candidatus Omnitrophota bacterium]MDD5654518.1 MBL fold metallo-hydrolase [Candidatus Omnitrophota bacterium]
MLDKIHWFGQSAFLIESSSGNIYIDPEKIREGLPSADLILITHAHGDHCSPGDIKRLYNVDTLIVSSSSVAKKLSFPVKVVRPGDKLQVKGVNIEVTYAYNINKPFHPRSEDNLGYLFEADGTRFYHAGDTDNIPEMGRIKADIAMLPIGGTFTMNARSASEAANLIKPKIAIPMHWGGGLGSKKDALEFEKLCSVEVRILEEQ